MTLPRRLSACARDPADPARSARSVSAIAPGRGVAGLSNSSRAFRRRNRGDRANADKAVAQVKLQDPLGPALRVLDAEYKKRGW